MIQMCSNLWPYGSCPASFDFLDRLQAGDCDSWTRLVEQYSPLVRGRARQAGIVDGEICDVEQEVFVTVFRKVSRFRREPGEGKFRAWLGRLATNKAIDFLRRKRKRPVTLDHNTWAAVAVQTLFATSSEMDGEGEVGENLGGLDRLTEALEEARSAVAPRTWRAFEATFLQGEDPAAVGRSLGMTRGAVYNACGRFLKRLRDQERVEAQLA